MRLKRLELCGFKSFDDRMKIHFDHTVTGIVGPNGCGKSNVLDAIRWVMGEQSIKSLRGKSRSDVIFNGSAKRKGADVAEVVLVLEDVPEDKRPEGFEEEPEISITRRLDKSGNSGYLINGQPARLKDIRMLFTGTGLGKNSYAIIEQGKVNEFIQSSPDQRRLWIEEAAGISRYKEQRKTAESKMKQTESHLERLNDVLKTLGTQRKSLQRQAGKARKNRELREEIEDLDLYLSAHKYLQIWARQRQLAIQLVSLSDNQGDMRDELYTEEVRIQDMEYDLKEEAGELQDQRERLQRRLARLGLVEQSQEHLAEDLERLSHRKEQLTREQKQTQDLTERTVAERSDVLRQLDELIAEQGTQDGRLAETDSKLQELEETLRAADEAIESMKTEVIEAATQTATKRNQVQEVGRRLTEAAQRVEDNAKEQEEAVKEYEEAQKQHQDAEERLERCKYEREDLQGSEEELASRQIELRKEVAEAEKIAREVQEKVAEHRARLHSLKEIQNEYRDLNESSRALMTARDEGKLSSKEGIQGALANWVAPEEKYEKAVAAALGDRLQYLVVDSTETALECIRYLRSHDAGRTGFVAFTKELSEPVIVPEHPSVLGHLFDFVKAPSSHASLFQNQLSQTLLVDDLSNTLDLNLTGELSEVVLVDLQGDIRHSSGCLIGGQELSASLGMLQRRRQIKELEVQVEDLELLWDEKEERREELQDELEDLIEERQRQREQIQMLVVKETALKKDLQRLEADYKRLHNQKEVLEREASRLQTQIQTLKDEHELLERRLQELTLAYEQREEALQEKRAQLERDRAQQQELVEALTAIKVEIAARSERQDSLRQQIDQLTQRHNNLQERNNNLSQEFKEVSDTLVAKQQTLKEAKEEQVDLQQKIDSEEKGVKEQIQKYAEAEQELEEAKRMVEQLRKKVENLRELRTNYLLEQRECEVQLEALDHEVRGRYGFPIGEALPGHHCRPIPGPEDEKRLKSLQKQLMKIGEVNALAEEEFKEVDEKFQFLKGQIEDLEKTIASLRKTIQKINQKTKELFRETYDAIRQNFQYLFPKLFEGGHADLILTDPNDLLATGVDISVRPPGKRRQNVILLSGGEKALTTTALIFSFFLHKPSPFCILDEVDAPLDDVNIDRYNRLLRELCEITQFLVITHNKRTMELADQLYGVTMQEPGVSSVLTVKIEEVQDDDDFASAA